jgi:hypothetical protein
MLRPEVAFADVVFVHATLLSLLAGVWSPRRGGSVIAALAWGGAASAVSPHRTADPYGARLLLGGRRGRAHTSHGGLGSATGSARRLDP